MQVKCKSNKFVKGFAMRKIKVLLLRSQRRGQGFDPLRVHQIKTRLNADFKRVFLVTFNFERLLKSVENN